MAVLEAKQTRQHANHETQIKHRFGKCHILILHSFVFFYFLICMRHIPIAKTNAKYVGAEFPNGNSPQIASNRPYFMLVK